MSDRPEPPRTMTAEEVDEKLAAMERAADVLLREWEDATRAMDEADAVSEGRIERAQHSKEPYSPFDAESVLASVRLRLTVNSDKEHRHAAREFVCWWVDAAVTAWRSAALGVPLSPTRWGAVAPQTLMFKEELALLPRADEHARTIVELGLAMGGPRSEIGELGPDPVALALDEAKRSGLRIRRNTEGEIEVVDGDEPEERRRRMWGTTGSATECHCCPTPMSWTVSSPALPTHRLTAWGRAQGGGRSRHGQGADRRVERRGRPVEQGRDGRVRTPRRPLGRIDASPRRVRPRPHQRVARSTDSERLRSTPACRSNTAGWPRCGR